MNLTGRGILGPPTVAADLPPGTVIRRWYKGFEYVVNVLDHCQSPNGRMSWKAKQLKHWRYLYNGRRYRTLSAVAYEITGDRYWSGNNFFGLRDKLERV